ncbi:hypothetical protein JCM19053_1314 [Vibrio sp. JCM 19053]|nr:hypothetical protein JCM19053_1314 [Vibrio sp. JCM 19053]
MQIPHHGSKRNIGTTVLNRLVGEPISQGVSRNITAIASTAKNGEPKHPRKAVMNAFTHRGVNALATRGSGIRHHYNAPGRDGWNSMNLSHITSIMKKRWHNDGDLDESQ